MKMKKMMLRGDLDYVALYAKALKRDSSVFKQQKMLIESQMNGSAKLFRNMFSAEDFKKGARNYLKQIKIL